MFKGLGIGILTVNAVYASACLKDKIKDVAIDELKKKIKEEDEKQMKLIQSKLSDGSTVISHTNTINSDEFLKADTLVLKEATEEDKKKLKEIFEKNKKQIIANAKYGKNTVYHQFNIKVNDNVFWGLIEFDKSKIKQGEEVKVILLENLEKDFVLQFEN